MALPGHLIDEYWNDVIRQLSTRCQLPREDAARKVALFRSQLASVDADELVYHRDALDVARSIEQRQSEGVR